MTAAKKTVAKKVVPKKPAPKVTPKAPSKPVEPAEKENRVLYTIRLEPSIIAKLNEMATKLGTTHAAVARGILQEGV